MHKVLALSRLCQAQHHQRSGNMVVVAEEARLGAGDAHVSKLVPHPYGPKSVGLLIRATLLGRERL